MRSRRGRTLLLGMCEKNVHDASQVTPLGRDFYLWHLWQTWADVATELVSCALRTWFLSQVAALTLTPSLLISKFVMCFF